MAGIQASIKRLHPKHEAIPILSTKEFSLEAGIAGEAKLAEILHKHSYPFEHRILHDLSLLFPSSFQIDSLFLTQFYTIIFEVKNIGGRLEFKENPPQLVRTRETGEVDGFESPAAQVERIGDLLGAWFKEHGINIPVYRVVVLAYPRQIVDRPPAKTPVLFPSHVPQFIRDLPRKKPILDYRTFNWLSEKLVASHHNYIPRPVCDIYNIPRRDIRTGVICPGCGAIGMMKIARSWRCRSCGCLDHKAHERSVRDWFLIMGREMTNRDCREFLRVDSTNSYKDFKEYGPCCQRVMQV
ncbi:nuclease-related domain-containing protein [Siminovitchia acidinfaciens]|uniref:nuclease-related domain-containing protein n=1 Tax=Siminovitchia acidinfaciens TaxID=2321395 RepID=UPI0013DF474F|nr:nuclease-related domain-containing protein [Siminovitchia acidinfaciens]